MRFAEHWVKAEATARRPDGTALRVDAYGWSKDSPEEARRMAEERAARAAERFAAGAEPERYGYLDRPMREPILSIVVGPPGSPRAVVTRNRYGAEVLNASEALFVDVDVPAPRPAPRRGLLARLLGGGPEPAPADDGSGALLKVLERLVAEEPERGFRVYRTAGGLRVLATHAPFDPLAEDTHALMDAMDADPLYRRLCRSQECFRARLTPKPWRVGVPANPVPHPEQLGAGAKRFARWQERYDRARWKYATCALLTTVGSAFVAPELVPVVEHHDRATGCDGGRPLA